jgi:hypothetical protein
MTTTVIAAAVTTTTTTRNKMIDLTDKRRGLKP